MAIPMNSERTPLLDQTQGDTYLTGQARNITGSGFNATPATGTPDEEAQIDGITEDNLKKPSVSVGRIISILLIGSFISNADGSLLFTTHPIIASEFNALRDSTWLLTSFNLAQAATQPLYGKLSDIYGRKSLLIFAYMLFTIGLALVGVGQSMPTLILGRVISGAGCSGMSVLVSILITDLVPLRDVASWRSYVNIVMTTGRSIGGPLGGWLADTVGWRWSFLGQIPFACIAMILIGVVLPSNVQNPCEDDIKENKLARIDFAGATFLALSILAILFPLELGGDWVAWNSPTIIAFFASAIVFIALFLVIEGKWAREPIMPLSLLGNRDVMVSSLIMCCQCAAQMGLMFAVPLYFQVTASATNTVAGAHLVPAVIGNAIGGIISGRIINRTGRYKFLISVATLAASSGYFLCVLRWHGDTNLFESLYIFPTGFGMGIAQSALFISVQAATDPALSAIAASVLYMMNNIGNTQGTAGISAVLQGSLRSGLADRLSQLGFTQSAIAKVIKHAVSDVHYVDKADPVISRVVRSSYIDALMWTHVASLVCALSAFIASLFLRQYDL